MMLKSTIRSVNQQLESLCTIGVASGWTDAELLDRVADRDGNSTEQALRVLIDRHGRSVMRVCGNILSDPHDVADAFQETFVTLFRKAGALRRKESVGWWLHEVAYRAAVGLRSSSARRRRHELRASERSPLTTRDTVTCDDYSSLHEELRRLPPRFRDPLVLCYFEERTCDDAARTLGLPVGTIKSRLARGRERLRERLGRRGWEAPAILWPTSLSPPVALVEATVRAALVNKVTRVIQLGMIAKAAAWLFASGALLTAGTVLCWPARGTSASAPAGSEPRPPASARVGAATPRQAATLPPSDSGGPADLEADPPGVLPGPSRADVVALLRKIDRDPVTRELVDRVLSLFRPRVFQRGAFDRVSRLATDPDFVRRIDAISREILGRPADDFALIERANHTHTGREDPLIRREFSEDVERKKKTLSLSAKVVDAESGNPLPNIFVSTHGTLTRTDGKGEFMLNFTPWLRPFVKFHCEAKGYALRELVLPFDELPLAKPPQIEMYREVPVAGEVVDQEGHPIRGATVELWADRRLIDRDTWPKSDPGNAVIFVGITDETGKFSIRGVPLIVPDRLNRGFGISIHRVFHPSYATFNADGRSTVRLDEHGPTRFTLQPGCVVTGVVVDRQGEGLQGAWIKVLSLHHRAYDIETFTSADGRFTLRNVSAGEHRIVVEPERHAMEVIPVTTIQQRPIDLHVVVKPGAFLVGKVVGADGKPSPDAAVGWLSPLDPTGKPTEAPGPDCITLVSPDGSFRLGPVPEGEYNVTGLVHSPRAIGEVKLKTGQTGVVIKLAPDPEHE